MDFLSQDNVCGQSLLKLVARGSAILAELQRLSDNIPKIFFGTTLDNKKYNMIIFDFEYLKNVDAYEERIQSNLDLLDLDENFKETYLPLLERFYILFESILKYYFDLKTLLEEIHDAVFIQYTLENILDIVEGKKLMGESFYLYGCMLLLMDNFIPGQVREKIIISYYRYKGGQSAIETINNVTKLCKNTGYLSAKFNNGITRRPEKYPDEYFMRFRLDPEVVNSIIVAIKEDDIYRQLQAYPSPEHRSIALSNQASMIFVLLYFNTNILNKEKAKMREIVDKHFYDNWVIPYYLGYTVDLIEQWDRYQAAKEALQNTIQPQLVKGLTDKFIKKMYDQNEETIGYLIEGVLSEDFVIKNIHKLLLCLRESNVAVRWLILHRRTNNLKLNKIVNERLNQDEILTLLLNVSKFESLLKNLFEMLLETKQQRWDQDKQSSCEKMDELADYFSGTRPLSRVQPDPSYQNWFLQMKNQISSLTYSDSTYAGRKIQQLTKALDDVEQYHQIENNLQIKQYLHETKINLRHMVTTVHIKKNILESLALISDITYSWESLKDFREIMQEKIKKNPSNALLLKSTFMKLSSILNTPIVRIIQANSEDFVSVSKYYSGELVKFVKEVLQIIPISVFDLLEQMIILLTHKLKKVQDYKIKRDDLKEYAQPEERAQIARLTHEISVFTESILAMETYLVGIIEVNPKEILEDGIRRELIKLICRILDKILIFKLGTVEDFEKRLQLLADNLEGFKKALEFIQDFLHIYGLKIFYEQFNYLINCYIDMESNAFLTKKQSIEELAYDDDIPIPDPRYLQEYGSINFMGRLLREVLNLTHPKKTKYVESCYGFYDIQTQKEVINMKSMHQIRKCIGVSGMVGLDRLLSYMVVNEMRGIIKMITAELDRKTRHQLRESFEEIRCLNAFIDKYEKIYSNLKKILKGLSTATQLPIQRIGQYILLRRLICNELQMSAKIYSNKLYLSLQNLNQSMLNDLINRKYINTELNTQENIQQENELIFQTSKLLDFIGMCDSQNKIYITIEEQYEDIPLVFFILAQSIVSKLQYNQKLNIMEKVDKKEILDGTLFIVGLNSFIHQFHPNINEIFLGLMTQYMKELIHFVMLNKGSKNYKESMLDLINNIPFFEQILLFSGQYKQDINKFADLGVISGLDKDILFAK